MPISIKVFTICSKKPASLCLSDLVTPLTTYVTETRWGQRLSAPSLVLLADSENVSCYRIAEMFGGVYVWRINKIKVFGKKKFGEWINFGHKDTIYKLIFGWLKFGEVRQFKLFHHQAFFLYSIYIMQDRRRNIGPRYLAQLRILGVLSTDLKSKLLLGTQCSLAVEQDISCGQ